MMPDVMGSWEDDLDLLPEQHIDEKAELIVAELERYRVGHVALLETITGDFIKGTLILTNYRLLWIGPSTVSIPLGCVNKVMEVIPPPASYGVLYATPRRAGAPPFPITIHCKDGRWFKLQMTGRGDDVDALLEACHRPIPPFAFAFRAGSGDPTPRSQSTPAAPAPVTAVPPAPSTVSSSAGSSFSGSFVLLNLFGDSTRCGHVDSPPPLPPASSTPSAAATRSSASPSPVRPPSSSSSSSWAASCHSGPHGLPGDRHATVHSPFLAPRPAPSGTSIPIPIPPHPAAGSSPGSCSSNGSLPPCLVDRALCAPPLGWAYDPRVELSRMGVDEAKRSGWRVTSTLNADFKVCPTYPRTLCIPAAASDDLLRTAALFRSRGRLPVLCWRCGKTGRTITRSSQPLVGFRLNRCPEDEQLVAMIRRASGARTMYIFDCRPKFNAVANAAMSGGFESAAYYDRCKVVFCGIPNLHTMRDSLERLQQLAVRARDDPKPYGDANYLSSLESTQWLDHIRSLLILAVQIADVLTPGSEEAASVLVHCSDGWDRTAQLCSLAQVLLDPYYRTLTGFITLIEKDWLAMGHKFGDRAGNHIGGPVGPAGSTDQTAPIFLQFVCCVRQVMEQFPSCFEFNEAFLFWLLEHHVSALYGTFLGNSEKERVEADVAGRTFSLWDKLAEGPREFLNVWYDRRESPGPLRPDPSLDKLAVWATVPRSQAETRMRLLMQERQVELLQRLHRYKAANAQLRRRRTDTGPGRLDESTEDGLGAGVVLVPRAEDRPLSPDGPAGVAPAGGREEPAAPAAVISARRCDLRPSWPTESRCGVPLKVGLAETKLIEDYFST